MTAISPNLARISSSMLQTSMLDSLHRSNMQLFEAQQQLATGKRVNRPSDDSSVVSTVTLLQRIMAQHGQQLNNFSRAQVTLDTADQSLSNANDILLDAQNIASSQVGIGSNSDTRANQAAVVSSMINELMNIGNREVRGIHLFGGTASNTPPFVEQFGGIRYTGTTEDLGADLGLISRLGVNSNGADAFNALSSRVAGDVDLNPAATDATKLTDVAGARNRGVNAGAVTLDVNGTPATVDLTGADTLGDIVTRINAAIDDIDPTAGALTVAGDGFQLTANASHQISITDIGDGVVAADLGIALNADASASAVAVLDDGPDLNPRLTELTRVSSFGPAVDLTSGLRISNGSETVVVDFTGANTVQDLINRVKAADIGVRMQINATQTGFTLVNEVSGTHLTIGEEAGGSTATDLGLRSMSRSTALADLNFGRGVEIVSGADMEVHLHDGTSFQVDLSGAVTLDDVINRMQAAATTAGLVVPTDFSVGFVGTGNGLSVNDNTVGGGAFRIVGVNGSHAAHDLGINTNVGAANNLTGEDVGQIRTESVFTHLMMLRDGLLNDDSDLITEAGGLLQDDTQQLTTTRAELGARAQRIQEANLRLEDRQIADEALMSELVDADFNEVITRFTQLQQQLQANLLSGQQLLDLNVLNFLR
jgi:flagellar hook-associated protein 3 FlgL